MAPRVAARLSVKLDRPSTNNVDIAAAGDSVTVTTAIFGGNTLVTTSHTGAAVPRRIPSGPHRQAADGAAAACAAPVPDLGVTGPATEGRGVEESSGQTRRGEHRRVRRSRPGERASTNDRTARQIAEGGTGRAAANIVGAGWVPYSYQVGQTVVKPTLYIAPDSGPPSTWWAKGSKNIIAIIKDKSAHLLDSRPGIVGDVHKVPPKLIEAL